MTIKEKNVLSVVSLSVLYCTTSGSFPLSLLFLAAFVSMRADSELSVLCLKDLE